MEQHTSDDFSRDFAGLTALFEDAATLAFEGQSIKLTTRRRSELLGMIKELVSEVSAQIERIEARHA